MMSNWERTTHKRKKKLQRRIRKGVPSVVRGEVWTMLTGVPRRVQETDVGRYEELMRISGEVPPEEVTESAGAEVAESAGADIAIDQASDRNRATPVPPGRPSSATSTGPFPGIICLPIHRMMNPPTARTLIASGSTAIPSQSGARETRLLPTLQSRRPSRPMPATVVRI